MTEPGTERPAGAYLLGALGGALFGVGSLSFTMSEFAQSSARTLETLALFGMAGGGLLLGIAWVLITRGGMFKGQHGGFMAVAGSFAVPASMLFAWVNRKDWDAVQTAAMLVVLSTALFAFGHAIVRGAGITRVVSRIALVPIAIEVLGVLGLFRLGFDGSRMVILLATAGLATIGFVVMLELPRMKNAPPPGEEDLRL